MVGSSYAATVSPSSGTDCCHCRSLLFSHALITVPELLNMGFNFTTRASIGSTTTCCRCQRLLISHALFTVS
eukprot:2363173-Pyramimonas_sp.AAC.1